MSAQENESDTKVMMKCIGCKRMMSSDEEQIYIVDGEGCCAVCFLSRRWKIKNEHDRNR
jgi:hypothetical protein